MKGTAPTKPTKPTKAQAALLVRMNAFPPGQLVERMGEWESAKACGRRGWMQVQWIGQRFWRGRLTPSGRALAEGLGPDVGRDPRF